VAQRSDLSTLSNFASFGQNLHAVIVLLKLFPCLLDCIAAMHFDNKKRPHFRECSWHTFKHPTLRVFHIHHNYVRYKPRPVDIGIDFTARNHCARCILRQVRKVGKAPLIIA
jgi:hypothetical protein